MKKNLLLVGLGAVALLIAILVTHAAPTIVAGAPAVVNNTSSNFPAIGAFQYNPALQQWSITHGSLNYTTDMKVNIFLVLPGTGGAASNLIYTWYPANTNATTEYIYAGSILATNNTFPQVVTTNSQSFYIGYGQ